jgi:hypothetical protein
MTNQEKWDEIVNKIEELGWELQEISELIPDLGDDVEMALASLRITVEELRESEIE